MNIYVINDNFVSFLCAIYKNYYCEDKADKIVRDINECTFLDKVINIDEDTLTAKKVKNGIIKKGGMYSYDTISTAYLSDFKNKENIIFNFLKAFFKYGRKTFDMHALQEVILFNEIFFKVNHEIHRLSAFIRLQEMENGIYYGYYTSDNDILEKLIPHYIPQFNSQKFILHDYVRKKMAFYDGKDVHFMIAPNSIDIVLSEKELIFQSLWKEYHKNVSISSRENLKQQNAYLPKRYRHFMNEF